MIRILGVDPGSRLAGYGCVEWGAGRVKLLCHGTIKLLEEGCEPNFSVETRLAELFTELSRLALELKPQVMVVEKAFFAKNAASALKLGQSRGVVLLVAGLHQLELVEVAPTQVKRAIAGYGLADKTQVAKMLQLIFGGQKFETPDASDGLALAVYHAHTLGIGTSSRQAQILKEDAKVTSRKRSSSLAEAVRHRVTSKTRD